MVFNSNKFLVSQGWEGQGKALKKGGRARPISVVQKKTMSGVGKDTYNGFEWWDALFSGVAKKLNRTGEQPAKEHRTVTGILSPLPPPMAAHEPPKASTSQLKPKTSTDYIGQAKQEAAKARLYGAFLRGKVLEGNLEEEELEQEPIPVKAELATVIPVEVVPSEKDKKRRRILIDDGEEREETKEERRARRALKKAAKHGVDDQSASGSQVEVVEAIEGKPKKKKRRKENA